MRIGFVSKGTLRQFYEKQRKECVEEIERVDVLLFGFNGMSEVSYEKELKGETDFFEDAARLSKLFECVVVCGCVTDTRGHKRKSAVVAENGKLVGVSDMLHVIDNETSSGAALRVYDTKAGKMGVVVAEDLLFPETVKTLTLCGSDFLVCPFAQSTTLQSAVIRTYAYCYGVPLLFCASGYAALADVEGDISFASPQSPAYLSFTPKKEYHLVETRRRGFYRPKT